MLQVTSDSFTWSLHVTMAHQPCAVTCEHGRACGARQKASPALRAVCSAPARLSPWLATNSSVEHLRNAAAASPYGVGRRQASPGAAARAHVGYTGRAPQALLSPRSGLEMPCPTAARVAEVFFR